MSNNTPGSNEYNQLFPPMEEDGQEVDGDREDTKAQQLVHQQQHHQKCDASDSRTLEFEGEQGREACQDAANP